MSRQALSPLFVLLALLAAVGLGGLHALSPGHGKTVVGAYLVGARGTPRHAAILGLTVTLTHTSGVFALGLVTLFASRYVLPEQLYPWLSTTSGLLVAAIGGWLLWTRLHRLRYLVQTEAPGANQAPDRHGPDDAALHGHAHDDAHQHGQAVSDPSSHVDSRVVEHDHGTGVHRHVVPASGPISMRSLLALGVSGGLLPCPSALVVLLAAISLQRVLFGIVLVIAFSIGLAAVLTGIGLLLVYARGFFGRHRFEVGPGRLLPAASASVVLLLGLGIALQALVQAGVVTR